MLGDVVYVTLVFWIALYLLSISELRVFCRGTTKVGTVAIRAVWYLIFQISYGKDKYRLGSSASTLACNSLRSLVRTKHKPVISCEMFVIPTEIDFLQIDLIGSVSFLLTAKKVYSINGSI